ncbi:hypothetical protein LXL04_034950 [Taraxacum kok-saghyz]
MKLMNQNEKSSTESNNSPTTTRPTKNPRRKSVSQLELLQREAVLSKEREIGYEAVLSERDEREYELEQMVMESKQREAYLENELANLWSVVSRVRNLEAVENEIDVEESSTESRSVGGVENISHFNGLCNSTRLICKSFQMYVIDAEIVVGHHAEKIKKKFPIRLSFAMTINKTQGQTIPIVGVYYRNRCSRKLYVALSRGISCENTKMLVKPVKEFINEGVYTSNVVYREVLHGIVYEYY